MIYTATITTEANTAEASAVETVLSVTKGLVWRVEIEFPAGCCGLMRLQIYDGSYQLLPSTPREFMRGDGVVVGFDDLYLKDAAPFVFKIRTWNLDTVWPHTVQVRVCMASERAFMSRYMPSLAWEEFERILAEAAAGQEAMKAAQLEEMLKEITGG